jgi:hypothetical protein
MITRADFRIVEKEYGKSVYKTYLLYRADNLSFEMPNSNIPVKSIEFLTQFDAENYLNQIIIFYQRK